MTERQEKAEKFLKRYETAYFEYLKLCDDYDFAFSRAENIRSSSDIASGWTGLRLPTKKHSREEGEKIRVPLERSKYQAATIDVENRLDELIERGDAAKVSYNQLKELEYDIDRALTAALEPEDAVIMHMQYINFRTQQYIADTLGYERSTIARRINDSLHTLGGFLSESFT